MQRARRIVSFLIVLSLAVQVSTAQSRAVTVARSPDGRLVAGYAGDGELRLWSAVGSPGDALALVGFSRPRFDDAQGIFLTRSRDDGLRELERSYWRLDLRSGALAPAAPYETSYAAPVAPVAPVGRAGAPVRFCLDAGHGGSDPGALGNGLREADVNLDVCLRLARLLDRDTFDTAGGGSWDVLLTRAADVFVGLQQRTDMANAFGATTFLSVHMNSFTSAAANGTETYCYLGKSTSAGGLFRDRLQLAALAAWGLTDRGVKEANFFVLRETNMPAALLEGGFITNPGDAVPMAEPAERERLALELLFAVQAHHGFAPYEPRLRFRRRQPGQTAP